MLDERASRVVSLSLRISGDQHRRRVSRESIWEGHERRETHNDRRSRRSNLSRNRIGLNLRILGSQLRLLSNEWDIAGVSFDDVESVEESITKGEERIDDKVFGVDDESLDSGSVSWYILRTSYVSLEGNEI